MLERVDGLGIELLLVDELAPDQLAKRVLELRGTRLHDSRQHRLGELLADHRRRLQHRLLPLRHPVDARREDRLHARRHRRVLDRACEPVGAALALEVGGLEQ